MSVIFRTKDHLTIAQLAWSWARELAPDEKDFEHEHANLVQTILEDVVNGRFDEAGPLRDGRRLGLRIIIEGKGPGFIEGHELRPLLVRGPAFSWFLDLIVTTKEAALDFARRRKLPTPSWWTDSPDLPTGARAASKGIEPAANARPWSPLASGHPESPSATAHPGSTRDSAPAGLTSMPGRGGRRPKKRNEVMAAMKEHIEQGRITEAALRKMPEKILAADYRASRETVRKARDKVLSEILRVSETQFPTKPTTRSDG